MCAQDMKTVAGIYAKITRSLLIIRKMFLPTVIYKLLYFQKWKSSMKSYPNILVKPIFQSLCVWKILLSFLYWYLKFQRGSRSPPYESCLPWLRHPMSGSNLCWALSNIASFMQAAQWVKLIHSFLHKDLVLSEMCLTKT